MSTRINVPRRTDAHKLKHAYLCGIHTNIYTSIQAFRSTQKMSEIKLAGIIDYYDAVFFPGGHGPLGDLCTYNLSDSVLWFQVEYVLWPRIAYICESQLGRCALQVLWISDVCVLWFQPVKPCLPITWCEVHTLWVNDMHPWDSALEDWKSLCPGFVLCQIELFTRTWLLGKIVCPGSTCRSRSAWQVMPPKHTYVTMAWPQQTILSPSQSSKTSAHTTSLSGLYVMGRVC